MGEVPPQHMLSGEPQGGHPTVIVNPFADVNLLQQSPNSKTSLISSGNPASSLNSSPGLGGMIPSRASERFSSLRAKSNKLNAKLNQQQQYQLSSRGDPSSSSSSSTTSSSGSGLSSSATASSTA